MVNYDKMDRNQVREREFQVLVSGMAPALGKLSWWEEKSVKETLLCGAHIHCLFLFDWFGYVPLFHDLKVKKHFIIHG